MLSSRCSETNCGNARGRGHILERAVATIPQQLPSSIASNDEQIQPPVVVDIRERRERCPAANDDTSRLADVAGKTALYGI